MYRPMRFLNSPRALPVLGRAIISSLLLALTACGIPSFRQPDAPPSLPPTFNGAASSESSAQIGIAEFFNDEKLAALINQGLADNRELRILNEEIQIAFNEYFLRQGTYLPFLSFGANADVNKYSTYTEHGSAILNDPFIPPDRFLPNPLPNYNYGLNLFWQIDVWRQLRNARDAAFQRYIAATERRLYVQTRLVAEIADKYYELMAYDKRLEVLNQTIELQEKSLKLAEAIRDAGRGKLGDLPVRRFQAEVRKNESEKLIVRQEIVQAENRINFLLNRPPQPVERLSARFFDLNFKLLSVGVPEQLLLNRPDIRQAEREIEAAGLDVLVARAKFFPKFAITAGVGYEAFNLKYLFYPDALIYNFAGNMTAPIVNKRAIQAEYSAANAVQLQSIYRYQRTVLDAFTQVVNQLSKVDNYSKSIDLKKEQLKSLNASIEAANTLFQGARVEYLDVLFAQRDYLEARTVMIETRKQQLSAIVNTYQALGGGAGGALPSIVPPGRGLLDPGSRPFWHLWHHSKHE